MEIVGPAAEQTDDGKHISVDAEILEKLVNFVETLKAETSCSFSLECSIYRVPKRLRKLKEKAYEPQVISIGPLHREKKELEEPEEHKKLYLKEFLELSKVSVKEHISLILGMEARLRSSYAENLGDLNQPQFVEMILLDCSFVIMFLLKLRFSCIRSRNTDPIFNKPGMSDGIIFDLCLLENQLPFFILEELLEQSKIQDSQEIRNDWSKVFNGHQFCPEGRFMRKLTYAFLSSIWDVWVPKTIWGQIKSLKVDHFVDFLRICQLPHQEKPAQETQPICQLLALCLPICQQPAQETPPEEPKGLTVPRVAELRQAGIEFIKSGSSKNLLDIKFNYKKRRLEIPRLRIDDQTEILFRNLQAFEQWNYAGDKTYVNDYITMLHLLVRAAKDVEILVKEGIIDNLLHDSSAVSSLFKNLYKGNLVDMENFYFSSVVKDLNDYHNKRRHRWKAALKQKYFYNPWVSISVVAAVLLLILTFVQAVCSIIQVI